MNNSLVIQDVPRRVDNTPMKVVDAFARTRWTIRIDQSAKVPQPARPGGEFFVHPADPTQRRYEALRAYLVDGLPAAEVAARFGYTPGAVQSLVRDFRGGQREFFRSGRPGPTSAPAKDAARERILKLRAAGHSIDEIGQALAAEATPLNRTGVLHVPLQ